MALPLSNTFETGLADETAITALNSDDGSAGNAFDAVFTGGTGTYVYDTARAAHGTLSARCTPDSSNPINLEWNNTSAGDATDEYGRLYLYRTAWPTPDLHWLVRYENSAGTVDAVFGPYADGKIYVYDATLTAPASMTSTLPLNEWVRLEWHITCSDTTGLIEVKMFSGDSTSPIETLTRTNVDTNANARFRYIGHAVTGANQGSAFWIDDVALSATGYIGPVSGESAGVTLRTVRSGLRW